MRAHRDGGYVEDSRTMYSNPLARRHAGRDSAKMNPNDGLLTHMLPRITSFSRERTSARMFSKSLLSCVELSVSRFINIITPIMTNSTGLTPRVKAFIVDLFARDGAGHADVEHIRGQLTT